MEDWQIKLYLEAQAEMVRVDGMKAENMHRQQNGESMAYTNEDFMLCAHNIELLARQIGGELI